MPYFCVGVFCCFFYHMAIYFMPSPPNCTIATSNKNRLLQCKDQTQKRKEMKIRYIPLQCNEFNIACITNMKYFQFSES